jgi:two-component system, OmpR family, alkaline phosphatase synthesis response regulator PhoP
LFTCSSRHNLTFQRVKKYDTTIVYQHEEGFRCTFATQSTANLVHNVLMRILLVEDEPSIRDVVRLNLEMEGYEVITTANGRQALEFIRGQHFDLILLDVMLPEVDGFAIAEQVRITNIEVPILMLTAKDQPADRIAGLKKGADDYLTKPFNLEELLLRVQNLLRRSLRVRGEAGDTFEFGGNLINFETYEATTYEGQVITLTKKEALLLRLLIERKNEVVSRQQILQTVWGYDVFPSTRTIDNFILSFRKYFEPDQKQPRYFHSIRGVGYKLVI